MPGQDFFEKWQPGNEGCIFLITNKEQVPKCPWASCSYSEAFGCNENAQVMPCL